ncbi:MAG: hypothetical protein HKN71_07915 [Gemmatimonadetes bacterium]|nr:hypothetical protein [Gemmatimonadota bacterium]
MRFRAPLGTSAKWITGGVIVLFVGIVFLTPWGGAAVWVLMLALFAFGPNGYSFESHDLVVHRRAWSPERISLRGLKGVRIGPDLMARSIRTFGNGGVFGFTGWFHNSRLGRYRAWVTDPKRAVALEFGDRTVVVSPGRPHLFIDEVRERTGVEALREDTAEP